MMRVSGRSAKDMQYWNSFREAPCLRSLFLSSASILMLCAVGFSQTNAPLLNSVNDQTQMPIPGSGHDYQHLLGETVNYSNGSVSFKISFPTAPGRGISLPYFWSYNSASVNQLLSVDGNTPQWNNNDGLPWSQQDGLNLSGGTPYVSIQLFSISPPYGPPGDTLVPCNYQSGMTFTDSEGVTHNLNTGAVAPQYSFSGSQYIATCYSTPNVLQPGGDGQVVATLSPTAGQILNTNQPNASPFVVEDKDGTIYSFGSGGVNLPDTPNGISIPPESIEDRNGNLISFPSGPGTYTDTMGRPGPSGTDSSFTVDNLAYSSTWSTETVNYPITVQGGSAPPIGCNPFPTTVTGTLSILTSLTLPNGKQYQFFYGSYGLLREIVFPDGGWITYTWHLSPQPYEFASLGGFEQQEGQNGTLYEQPMSYGCNWAYQVPVLATRTVSFDGVNVAQSQTFTFGTNWTYTNGLPTGWSSKTANVWTTDNKITPNLTSEIDYTYTPTGVDSQPYQTSGIAATIPVEHTITYYDWGKTGPSKAKQITKTWFDQFNMSSQTTTIYGSGGTTQTSQTAYSYTRALCTNGSLSSFVYLTEQDDYDFSNGGLPGPLAKKTLFNYQCFSAPGAATYAAYNPSNFPANEAPWSNYVGLVLPPHVSSVTIEDGTNNIRAATQYAYDVGAPATVPSSLIQYDTNYNSVTVRSNLTSVTHCNPLPSSPGAPCTGPTTSFTYDRSGQPNTITDPKGNITQYSFADSFTDSGPSNPTNGYLTKITHANGLYSTNQYSYALGYLTTSTDLNPGNQTSYKYGTTVSGCSTNDYLNRPTEVDFPDGGVTTNCYDDSNKKITTSKLIDTGIWKTGVALRDGMFHTITTELTTDPEGTDEVDIVPDGEGRVSTKTNPYRPGHPSTTDGTTTYHYDAFGRTIQVSEPDGSLVQICYDANPSTPIVAYCSSGPLGQVKNGAIVDSTDEAGNHWQRMSDAFGRLTEVLEPNGTTQIPNMETDYTYNTLDDMTQVDQWGGAYNTPGERQRKFVYDPLGRLTSAQNPENGAITYAYTTSGSLCAGDVTLPCSKTDARGATINYSYDSLNRLSGKTYTGSGYAATGTVAYNYDEQSSAFPKGHRTSMTEKTPSATVVGTQNWSFDQMGRIAQITRSNVTSVSTQANTAKFTYNPGGLITKNVFFVLGSAAQYTYGGAGRPISVSWNGTVPYAYGALYSPPGQLVTLNLGGGAASGTELTLINGYNNRLQPTLLSAKTTAALLPLFNHNLYYSGSSCPGSPTTNSGNICQDVDALDATATATYTYDTLTRLSSVLSTKLGDSYTYDAFGNLYAKMPLGPGQGEGLSTPPPGNNNQLSIPGVMYDLAGNVLVDHAGASGTTYTWDAENRVATSSGPGGNWSYTYDGDGNRVQKSAGGSTGSVYWYGPDGSMTDESTIALNPSTGYPKDLQRNFYFNGKLIARQGFPDVVYPSYFVLSDQVGTSRVTVDFRWIQGNSQTSQYAPITTYYYPFGTYFAPPPTSPPTDSTLDQRFTGKIRDTETGNDYFGARYYTGSVSRFMSPDWSAKAEPVPYSKLDDPQTLNLYAYMENNPLRGIDVDGHAPLSWGGFENCASNNSSSSECEGAVQARNAEHAATQEQGVPTVPLAMGLALFQVQEPEPEKEVEEESKPEEEPALEPLKPGESVGPPYGSFRPGSGPLDPDQAKNFRWYIPFKLKEPSTFYRFFGGPAKPNGRWFSFFPPVGSEDFMRDQMALPRQWNSMQSLNSVTIPAGQTVYIGPAAVQPGFGYLGGGIQVFVPNP
jgi:RHS repeat-associated protein